MVQLRVTGFRWVIVAANRGWLGVIWEKKCGQGGMSIECPEGHKINSF